MIEPPGNVRRAGIFEINDGVFVSIEVVFIESDDGLGPYGAKSVGESGKALSPAAIANAVSNAIGRRMKDLPITRDRILGALA